MTSAGLPPAGLPPAAPCVHIIDDDAAIRDSLVLLMESEGFRTRAYDSARKFIESPELDGLGCVISDVRMPDMSGLDLLAQLKAAGVRLPVVMITAYADVGVAVQAMKMGAADFIEKPCEHQALIAAVRAALADARTHEAERESYGKRLEGLSEREHAVLTGLLDGKLNKIIAYELGVSVRTVEAHRANIMDKTGASSLSELVRLSMLAGWK
jgi:two-component system, LuxR family, response regulator FixJ